MMFLFCCMKHQSTFLSFEVKHTVDPDTRAFFLAACPLCEKEQAEATEFWRGVYSPKGMTADQVRRELKDFHFVMDQVPKVYMHVTGERLSKVNYEAGVVIGVADEHLEEVCQEAIEDHDKALAVVERRIRKYLAFSHQDGKCYIYGDDGELQCDNFARHGRTIDFRREPLSDLFDIIEQTRLREYAAQQQPREAP